MRIFLITLLQLLFCSTIIAQAGQGSRATIMVIPWTTKDEDVREKLESDFNYRAILNEVRLAFDNEGYSTINFIQKLQNATKDETLGLSNWRTVFKDIAAKSGADIIVQAEIEIVDGKYGSSVSILLEAIETSSSESLANSGLLESGQFSTTNYANLAKQALENEQSVQTFLASLESKFRTIRAKGRSISLRIEVDQNSMYDLETYVGTEGDYLTDLIQDWIQDKCESWRVAGILDDVYFNIADRDASILAFDFVRIPMADAEGQRYDINNYARELRKAIAVMGIKSDKGENFQVRDQVDRNRLTVILMN
jgi:hypothetical protein